MADDTKSNAGDIKSTGGNVDATQAQTSALGDDAKTGAAGDGKAAKGNETALTGGDDKAKGADGDKAKGDAEKPVELKVKFADGVDPAKDQLAGKFLETAKKLKLSNEQAQELADLYGGSVKAAAEQALAEHDAEQAEWRDLLKADKEFGGDKYPASEAAARKAMAKYATPAFRQFLRDSGLGNNPELFRFVWRIGKEMADDSIGDTGAAGGAAKPKTDAQILYGSTPAKQES